MIFGTHHTRQGLTVSPKGSDKKVRKQLVGNKQTNLVDCCVVERERDEK